MLLTTKWFRLELNSELSGVDSSCRVSLGGWKHRTSSEEGPGLGMQAGDRASVQREDGKKANVRRITLTKAGVRPWRREEHQENGGQKPGKKFSRERE